MQNLVPKIMGWLVVIITLALAPTIQTTNTTVYTTFNATAHNATMIGMAAVLPFGAPLMIIGLLVAGGMFGVAGARGLLSGASIRDMMEVVGSVIIVIVALTFFNTVLGYIETLIAASSGFAATLYGIIAIVLYIAIIAGAGVFQIYKYHDLKEGKKGAAAAKL